MMGSKLILVLLGAPSGRGALLGAACHRCAPLGTAAQEADVKLKLKMILL